MPSVNGSPMSTSGRQKYPRSARMIRSSQARASMAPAAKAWPFTAASTGMGASRILASSTCVSATTCSGSPGPAPDIHSRSSPLEKNLPVPVSTAARGPSPRSSSSKASCSAASVSGLKRFSPSSMRRMDTGPVVSMIRLMHRVYA